MNGEGGGWTAHRATIHALARRGPCLPETNGGARRREHTDGVRVWNPFHG